MTALSTQYQHNSAPMIVSIPTEAGIFPLKIVAFAAMLVAFSSTSSQATTIGAARMIPGSSMASGVAHQHDNELKISDALDDIRRRSGLTWGQLATIFEVSRQTVHSWANGSSVRVAHVGRVSELLQQVRELDGLPAFKVRDRLLGSSKNLSNSGLESSDEPPILVSDNTPFVHQLELRPSKTKVKRV
jgi:DNA-binding transcriptional regulator YiaG